jgi:hypothetical protein
MDPAYRVYRMGRKRWVRLLGNLQRILKSARRVDRTGRRGYQQQIKNVETAIAALLNIIQHRGNRGPARWPREGKQRRRS